MTKNILCIFVSPSWQTLHMSILCLYFSNKIYFCNTHSDWLQLLLRASSWNHYRVTTEIWPILGWRGEVGRNLRLVKIWKHYHQLYQKYQITKRYIRQLIISLPEKMTCTILVNLCISPPCWTHDNKKKKMLYDKLMKCLIKQFFIKINIAQYLFQK